MGLSSSKIEGMTDDERSELVRLIPLARRIAAPVGPLHSAWDIIFDAEALLNNRAAIISDPVTLIKLLSEYDTPGYTQMNKDEMLKLADEIEAFDGEIFVEHHTPTSTVNGKIDMPTLKAIVREWKQFTQFEKPFTSRDKSGAAYVGEVFRG